MFDVVFSYLQEKFVKHMVVLCATAPLPHQRYLSVVYIAGGGAVEGEAASEVTCVLTSYGEKPWLRFQNVYSSPVVCECFFSPIRVLW